MAPSDGENTLIQQVLFVKSSFVAELDGVPSARPRTLLVVLPKLLLLKCVIMYVMQVSLNSRFFLLSSRIVLLNSKFRKVS